MLYSPGNSRAKTPTKQSLEALSWSLSGLALPRHGAEPGEARLRASPYQKCALCLTSHSSWAAKVEGIISTAAETLSQTTPWVWHCLEELHNKDSKTVIQFLKEFKTGLWHGQTGGKTLRRAWIEPPLLIASPTQILHLCCGT